MHYSIIITLFLFVLSYVTGLFESNSLIVTLFLILVFTLLGLFFSKEREIKNFRFKRYKYKTSLNIGSETVNSILFSLTKDSKYKLEYLDSNFTILVLSEKISFTSWGSYYLLENNNGKINIYLKPKLIFELNLFGKFDSKLNSLSNAINILNIETQIS